MIFERTAGSQVRIYAGRHTWVSGRVVIVCFETRKCELL